MITKKKSKNPVLAWLQNEDNMNIVYGLGAAVVILGALFKLQGWPGANEMLIAGLGTEALIFTLSAFDPPSKHEWDWSKVYPALGTGAEGTSASQVGNIMKEAKLDPAVLKSVGDGMKKMAAQATNINDLAGASVAAKAYENSIKGATESLNSVNESYSTISATAKDLATSSSSVKEAVGLTEEYKENLKSASNSLGAIVTASGQITETATSMTKAQNDAVRLQQELQDLTENLNKLNKIYVGMYDAMHK
ncbi:MAG: gliding motility protein GldL [Cytophagales bacterium]|nr:gliding motility protein GldL [Cytophagales bacterium]